ncbi:MAG TPA: Re/Si-specific NAD(P)(+) transhydrogenase subunit alpha [Acidimicrobiia bacterium]|jgi:NAD(P) transhydrogenase subunit alpha|nr:Re/Si-specific NAD(P)(+) transhydrogenase subunit alpha [Acidimicrobiia bacterium]
MRIAVPAESSGERRVAITPQVALRLIEDRHSVALQTGAGVDAGFEDSDYVEAGVSVVEDPLADADLVAVVGPPSPELARRIPQESILVGFLDPFDAVDLVEVLTERRITAFAMESIPRTTLAQSMDALSSQATAAGYHAVLMAAVATPRFFPMLTTAAGTIPPVKLLVLGAGVAGLQAIATARRLGAAVSAYDIRPEVKEQIESLGARFVAAPVDESAAAASGYAREVSDETQRRQQAALAKVVAESDVVVTTAQIPGAPAPLLMSREMVEQMRPGSVIVDTAAPSGGNCELTRPGERVIHHGVIILGPTDLPGRVAHDASQMYARNLASFLARIDGDGPQLDFDDEIISEACITHDGRVTHPVVRRGMGLDGGS